MVTHSTKVQQISSTSSILLTGQEVIRNLAPVLHVESTPEVPHVLNQEVAPQEDHPTNLTSQDLQITGAEGIISRLLLSAILQS